MSRRRRLIILLGVLLVCIASAGAYVGLSVARSHRSAPPPGIHVVNGATLETTSATSVDSEGGAKILFVSMIPDRTAGRSPSPRSRTRAASGRSRASGANAPTTRAGTVSASRAAGS